MLPLTFLASRLLKPQDKEKRVKEIFLSKNQNCVNIATRTLTFLSKDNYDNTIQNLSQEIPSNVSSISNLLLWKTLNPGIFSCPICHWKSEAEQHASSTKSLPSLLCTPAHFRLCPFVLFSVYFYFIINLIIKKPCQEPFLEVGLNTK